MKFEYEIVDVFTGRQFGGNPLAVVLNAAGLDSAQMQMIAAEFNLAETTFVLPPRDTAHTANVRIFTPRAEMPFAGHPNVGTAFVLAQRGSANGYVADTRMVFEEIAGLVSMELLKEGSRFTGARLASPQRIAAGETISSDVVAEACSLSPADIETRNHHPCIVSCGAPFVLAELRSREALGKARPKEMVFEQHFPRDRVTGIHLYVHAREEMVDIHSRMFAPLHGIQEDPATGSANVALIGFLAKLAPEKDADLAKRIGQGFDMGRPSVLEALAIKRGYEVTETLIGGACVCVMRGVLELR
jgi:trans-2,3-dihydro-3-hydroxyanthranilate isomerase